MKKINIDLDEILKQMDDAKDLRATAKQQLDYADSEIARLNDILQAVLMQEKKETMEHGKFKFGWVESKRTALNQQLLKENYPEIAEECTETKVYRKFECKLYRKEQNENI